MSKHSLRFGFQNCSFWSQLDCELDWTKNSLDVNVGPTRLVQNQQLEANESNEASVPAQQVLPQLSPSCFWPSLVFGLLQPPINLNPAIITWSGSVWVRTKWDHLVVAYGIQSLSSSSLFQ